MEINQSLFAEDEMFDLSYKNPVESLELQLHSVWDEIHRKRSFPAMRDSIKVWEIARLVELQNELDADIRTEIEKSGKSFIDSLKLGELGVKGQFTAKGEYIISGAGVEMPQIEQPKQQMSASVSLEELKKITKQPQLSESDQHLAALQAELIDLNRRHHLSFEEQRRKISLIHAIKDLQQ